MSTDIDTIYIGGEWVTPSSTNTIEIRSPATGEPVGSVIAAGERRGTRRICVAVPTGRGGHGAHRLPTERNADQSGRNWKAPCRACSLPTMPISS